LKLDSKRPANGILCCLRIFYILTISEILVFHGFWLKLAMMSDNILHISATKHAIIGQHGKIMVENHANWPSRHNENYAYICPSTHKDLPTLG